MSVHLHSEIGRLKQVVVHRPGLEVVRMTQDELEHLLFDDVLSQTVAASEHGVLQEVLAASGAEVSEIADLLLRALKKAPASARKALLGRVCDQAGVPELAPLLTQWAPPRLALGLIAGVPWTELDGAPQTLARLRAKIYGDQRHALHPLPNLMFMRDACFATYDRVMVGRMASAARAREPLLVSFALRWSGVLGQDPNLVFETEHLDRDPVFRSIEGGDVLVISERVIAIGCSERTTPQTIERVANEALFPSFPKLERVYVVMMPARRSVMHLDTILTHIDVGLFLGHAPLVGPGGSPVARLERDRPPHIVEGASVFDVLREELGTQVVMAPCGGLERLHQEREQWTDGSNAVCVAPGKIILYSRNVRTIELLERDHGFTICRLTTTQTVEDRAERIAAGMAADRTVFAFTGSELSRARGGARCLTMPLHREPLQ